MTTIMRIQLNQADDTPEFANAAAPAAGATPVGILFSGVDIMPSFSSKDYHGTFISVDPARSKAERADSTAIVVGSIFSYGENMKVYIHPNPINKKIDLDETEDSVVLLAKTVAKGYPVTIVVEDVGMQGWLAERLEKAHGQIVELFKVGLIDKETRLRMSSGPLRNGRVFFPRGLFEELENQLINFKYMKHDDLVDAFSMLLLTAMKRQTTYHPFPEQAKIQRPEKGEENDTDYSSNEFLRMGTRPITAELRKKIF